jgi:hypothetical protein
MNSVKLIPGLLTLSAVVLIANPQFLVSNPKKVLAFLFC